MIASRTIHAPAIASGRETLSRGRVAGGPPPPSSAGNPAPATSLLRDPAVLALFGGLLLLYLAGMVWVPLQEPDEGRYAAIAEEMARTGDWVTPHLNGIRYLEKPPLFFWLAAAAMKVLGPTEAAARLPSALASLATTLLVMIWAERMRGRKAAILAGMVLTSLPLSALFARMAIVDDLMTLFITLALFCVWRVVEEPERRSWALGCWTSLALAGLTKGPVGIVLPLASAAVFLAVTRNLRAARPLLHPIGLILFMLIAAPWYVAVSLRNPDFPKEFLVSENLHRFVDGGRFYRDHPIWFYLPVLLLAFLPWVLFLPAVLRTIRRSWTARREAEARSRLLPACAIAVPFVILSLGHSKLPHYLLPLCPAFVILTADALAAEWDDGRRPGWFRLVLLGAVVMVTAGVLLALHGIRPETVAGALGWHLTSETWLMDRARIEAALSLLPMCAAIFAAGGATIFAAGILLKSRRLLVSATLLAGAVAGMFLAALLIAPGLGPAFSCKRLAGLVANHAAPGEPVILAQRHLRGMAFYLRRPVILWSVVYNEFGHEISEAEASAFSLRDGPEHLEDFVSTERSAVVVAESERCLEQLRALKSLAFDVLDRDGSFLVVRARRITP